MNQNNQMKLSSVLRYISRMQKRNRDVIESKLNDHIAKIRKTIDNYETRVK